jgi:hypothetical protein
MSIRTLIATVLLAIATLAGLATPAMASTHITTGQWDVRTCAAFATWQHDPTAAHKSAVLADSRHADTYLRSDVWDWHLHTDPAWTRFVKLDCTTPAD